MPKLQNWKNRILTPNGEKPLFDKTWKLPDIELNRADCCPTEMTSLIIICAQLPMSIASSRGRSRASFPSRPRQIRAGDQSVC